GQRSSKRQTPSTRKTRKTPNIKPKTSQCGEVLVFGALSFSGAWSLALGALRMAPRLLPQNENWTGQCMMNKPLRILHLEDDCDFSDLVHSLLESEGLDAQLTLVSTRAEFEAALSRDTFDVILADYVLPEYNGTEALHY